jgi:hypothetical protein
MRRFRVLALMLSIAVPSFAKVHKDVYQVPCDTLWPAVKDTLRNSGKYGILGLDSTELTATYSMGIGAIGQNAGDFKKRVDKSLAELQKQTPPPAPPAKTETPTK